MELFNQIKNCIDDKGNIVVNDQEVKSSMNAAELLGESLLGMTLSVRGKKFIIRMLEIYYSGVKDESHDWYRTTLTYKTSKYKQHVKVQNLAGLRFYLSSLNVTDSYTRIDIVAGNEGVPISYLIRSVWDENINLIGSRNGSPNTVLQAMGIQPEDHGAIIEFNNSKALINIQDTHKEVISKNGFFIKRSKRINLNSDFEEKNQVLWNLYLDK